jgi:cell division protein FtsL
VEARVSVPQKRAARKRKRPGWVGALGWLVVLLASLALVTWRQTRGLALEKEVRTLETSRAMKEAERVELARRIEALRSRSRIVQVAHDRLGMHLPQDQEIVFLPLAGPVAAPAGEAP